MSDKVVRNISKEPICGIYQVQNKINNKVYIGQSIDIERRWCQHRYGKGSLILKNAIKKYGIDNFEFSVLEEIEFTNKAEIVEMLTALEQKWFNLKEPYKNGYNVNKSSKPNLTPNRDNHFGDRISKIKIENNHCGKPINQFALDGNFIKKWVSAAQIERVLGYYAENISACCLKKQNSSNNYIWRFEDDLLTSDDVNSANKSKRMSEVRQYNFRGELLNTFKNVKDAAQQTSFNESGIRQCCNGHIKTAYNYIWRFKNEELILLNHIDRKDYPIKQLSLNGELIMNWDNVYAAIDKLNFNRNSVREIYKCCENKKDKCLGYKWEWDL
jgi:group I intron endonuclease